MPIEILMPALSPSMIDGKLVRWHVREGQRVAPGDIIAEIETPQATMEVEAADIGRIERILIAAGTEGVPVNTPIAIILADAAGGAEPAAANSRPAVQGSEPEPVPVGAGAAGRIERTYREALHDALAEEMRRDPSVIVIGEDVAQNRGADRVTQGLLDEFGALRVVSLPPGAALAAASGVGAALAGMRPVVEVPRWGSALEALAVIVNEAAAMYAVTAGDISVPLVLRGPNGWSPGAGPEAGRCVAGLLAHVPGLKVVAPSNPADAKGLMRAALREWGPVIVLEHAALYEAIGAVPDGADQVVEIGRASVVRVGRDVTVVAYARTVSLALEAAYILDRQGFSAEVIDLRSLRPLDLAAICASVAKTNRLVIVEDSWPAAGIGAEICARVVEACFDDLDAPPARVTGADWPVPFAQSLEAAALPDAARIVAVARSVLCVPERGEPSS